MTKKPSATVIEKGGKVTYTYDVTNAGTMPLANIRVSDNKCSPVSYVKGDDNGDGLLTNSASGEGYPDETWVYPGHGWDTTLGAERPHLAEWLERGW